MDEWAGLRIAAIIAVWATAGGGASLAAIWVTRGGLKAHGPDNELLAEDTPRPERADHRVTAFSSAQVGVHGLIAVLTACLLTYAALRDDDRATGYIASLVALAVTSLPGLLMFRKWHRGYGPTATGELPAASTRVERRLPHVLVYAHGVGAVTTAALLIALIVVD